MSDEGGPERHEQAFERFRERLEEELGQHVERLVLYGSVAREGHHPESDVDVFAVVRDEEDKGTVYDLAAAAGREYGVHIAVIVRTTEEFKKTEDTAFTREVMDTGRAVV